MERFAEMPIQRFKLGPLDNNSYLIVDADTGEAALVDPSFGSERLLPEIKAAGYTIKYLLNTHTHVDHVVGNAFWVEETGAPLAMHPDAIDLLHALPEHARTFGLTVGPSPEPDLLLSPGQELMLGATPVHVVYTPGHAPGHVTFLVEDAALVGDVLFAGSIGRTDLPGGSYKTLLHSIATELLILPDETVVYPGHGEPTTIGEERRTNQYLQHLG